MAADRYLEPHQARERAPTLFEDLLGDSIERAFGEGVQTLPELVVYLNRSGPGCDNGEVWTEESFQALMARLGY
ncbi:MAG: recombinase-like helix-turn-helix domain-containing protein [Pseudomonas sp.]